MKQEFISTRTFLDFCSLKIGPQAPILCLQYMFILVTQVFKDQIIFRTLTFIHLVSQCFNFTYGEVKLCRDYSNHDKHFFL